MIQSRLPRTLLHVESELKPARSIRKREKWEGETGILGPCMDVLSPWLNVWLNGWLKCIPSTQQRGWFNKYLLKEKVRRRVREGDERERDCQTDRQTDKIYPCLAWSQASRTHQAARLGRRRSNLHVLMHLRKEEVLLRLLLSRLLTGVISLPHCDFSLMGHLASFLKLAVGNPDGDSQLQSDSQWPRRMCTLSWKEKELSHLPKLDRGREKRYRS